MLRQSFKKLGTGVYTQGISIHRNKALLACSVLNRNVSTNANTNKKQTTPKSFNSRRFVDIDSPFAKANKQLYILPEDPFIASQKLTKILETGTIEDAHEYVTALPISLQSVVSWNQLVGNCAKHGRATLAEKYYSQMRKRGIQPNERTVTQMLIAYANSNSPNAGKHAEAWFSKLKEFNIQPSIIHINNLMRVYNNAGLPEKTMELLKHVKNSNSSDMNLIPDAVTYTVALWACPQLGNNVNKSEEIESIWDDIIYRIDKTERSSTKQSPSSSLLKKAAEISKMEESITNYNKIREAELKLDDQLIMALLNAVARTAKSQSDALVGIELIDRFYSLCPPRAADIMKNNGIILQERKAGFGFQPSNKTLDAILRFAGGLKEFQLGEQYFNLALQQYPRLKPDKQAYNSYYFLKNQLKPKRFKSNKKVPKSYK